MMKSLRGRELRWSSLLASAMAAGAVSLGSVTSMTAIAVAAPADRGYEMVTPAGKDYGFGGVGGTLPEIAVASPDGDAVAYDANGPLGAPESNTGFDYYVGRRDGARGWGVKPISPPLTLKPNGTTSYPAAQGFSEDLSKAIFLTADPPLTSDALPGIAQLYIRDTITGASQLLTKGNVGGAADFSVFAGASRDFTHVTLEARDPLLPDGQGGAGASYGAYEWVGGSLRYVGVLPDGTSATPQSLVGDGASVSLRVLHAISDDGRRIVFTVSTLLDRTQDQLYLREDGSSTVLVSGSHRATPDPNGTGDAEYWGASVDTRKILFASNAELTDDANTGSDGSGNPTDAGRDLYLYDVATGELTDLSVDTNAADSATGAAVQGVVGLSDDAAYVYFVATGDLGGGAVSGSPNLYLWHDGDVRFVATLSASDNTDWTNVQNLPDAGITARVTPDGRYIALESAAALTGYNNIDPDTGTPHIEVYRYSADDDELICASCRAGEPARGDSHIAHPDLATSTPRNLSDDGRRLVFDSTDDLVPQDTNRRQDVYEYSGGGLHLISSGTSRYAATFQDASASGDDVFFSTRAQLVPQDQDDLVDLYDARVGGGFAVTAPAPCGAMLCVGAPPGSHEPSAPGSIALQGIGNVFQRRLVKPHFTVGRLTSSQRRLAARTGRLTVAVRVTDAGRIVARVRGKVGGRVRSVGRASRRASHDGVYHLALRLSKSARQALAQHRQLRLRLIVTYSKVSSAARSTVSLHR